MEVDTYSYIFLIIFLITAFIDLELWYFYGAIDSFNYDNIDENDNELHEVLDKFSEIYHTKLIIPSMMIFAISIFLSSFIDYGCIYAFVFTLLVITFRHLGYHKSGNINKFSITFTNAVYMITYPITFFISKIIKLTLRLVSVDVNTQYTKVTENEIISMVNDGQEQGILEKEEAEMINNIVELGEKEAMDIMTHRKNIYSINANQNLDDVFKKIISSNFSRYPVYQDEVDNILGVLHIRDFLRYYNTEIKDKKLSDCIEILKKPYFVPNTKDVSDIFKEMQEEKTHMAVVIDEYGQLDGIVTMEDIIEEVMGNILDEYDSDETMIVEQKNGTFLVRGICPLEDLEERLGINFGDEFETLNGFLISKLNKIPKDDENVKGIDYNGYNFIIKKVKNKVIQLVKIIKIGG